jgi:hypothetical protein
VPGMIAVKDEEVSETTATSADAHDSSVDSMEI